MEIVFESDNLYFVRVNNSLIKDYLNMMNDNDINKYLSLRKRTFDYEDEILWIQRNLNNTAYSIIEKKTNEFVGNIEILDVINNVAVIGIAITKLKQNRHYGSESIKRFIRYCIDDLNLDGIELSVYSHNKRAINCYLNLGFVEYNRIKNVGIYEHEKVDDIYMKLKLLNHKSKIML